MWSVLSGEIILNIKYIRVFVLLLAIYILLAFGLPANPYTLEKYRLSQSDVNLLNLTIVTPIVAVYCSALYGFLRFKDYALTVEHTKEGVPLKQLSQGLMILAFSLPINSITSSIVNYVAVHQTNFLPFLTMLRHYTNLVLVFIAFYYIAIGSANLLRTLKDNRIELPPFITLLGPIVLASIFTGLIMTQPHDSGKRPAYFLTDWMIVLTLIIPYVYIWCRGIGAAYNLFVYKSRVKGLVYKQAVNELAKGIGAIVALSISLQVIVTFSARIERLTLTPLLLIVYALIALYAVGYGLVARGAKRLKRIEDA